MKSKQVILMTIIYILYFLNFYLIDIKNFPSPENLGSLTLIYFRSNSISLVISRFSMFVNIQTFFFYSFRYTQTEDQIQTFEDYETGAKRPSAND